MVAPLPKHNTRMKEGASFRHDAKENPWVAHPYQPPVCIQTVYRPLTMPRAHRPPLLRAALTEPGLVFIPSPRDSQAQPASKGKTVSLRILLRPTEALVSSVGRAICHMSLLDVVQLSPEHLLSCTSDLLWCDRREHCLRPGPSSFLLLVPRLTGFAKDKRPGPGESFAFHELQNL